LFSWSEVASYQFAIKAVRLQPVNTLCGARAGQRKLPSSMTVGGNLAEMAAVSWCRLQEVGQDDRDAKFVRARGMELVRKRTFLKDAGAKL
jgi:hypothetical protein